MPTAERDRQNNEHRCADARFQLTYPQAFDLLVATSQDSKRKLAAVAEMVLRTGR